MGALVQRRYRGVELEYSQLQDIDDPEKCKELCDNDVKCGSIAYCTGSMFGDKRCKLFDLKLSGSELTVPSPVKECKSYYKKCFNQGI